MVWNSTAPDGSKAVGQNTTILQSNTTYTETTENIDHYWNIGADEDGHHKWVQTVASNDADSTLPTNVLKASGMDSVFYSRFVTATESPDNQECYPYFKNAGTNGEGTPFPLGVMQLLGMRAFAVVNRDAGTGVLTHKYSYNVTVTQTGTGKYLATYGLSLPMPNSNYGVLGGAVSNASSNGSAALFAVQATQGSNDPDTTKGTLFMRFNTYSQTGVLTDPVQIYFLCFGG